MWQCRRTAPICQKLLEDKELTAYIKDHTGLLVDAYFSATKLKWILDTVPGARERAKRGELLFGTLMSRSSSRSHWTTAPPTKTLPSRQYCTLPPMPMAMVVRRPFLLWTIFSPVFISRKQPSRTMLYNIRDLCWDQRICDALDIPMEMLPAVCGCSQIYGTANLQGVEVPVSGCAGDQQAALFGQR